MVEIRGTYRGSLRCDATHGPSGAEVLTDAPKDNAGEGASFSPTDLVATALATCVVTTMAIVARRRDVELGECRYVVTKEMGSEPRRHIARLALTVYLPASIDEKTRKILERAAHHCPVHASLGERTEAPITFVYE